MIEVRIVDNKYQKVEQIIRSENVENVFVPRVGEHVALDGGIKFKCVTRVVVEYTPETQVVRVYVE